jgi:recombination protein RecT
MAVNNSLVQSKGKQRLGLTAYLTQDAVKNNINQVVGGKDGQKFIASVVSAVQANPQLQECTNSSILSAALLGSSLNLTPSPQLGQYFLVPFNNSKQGIKEAQFQLGLTL